MRFADEAFSVNFIDVFRAGRAGGEPALGGADFQSANRGVIARRVGQFGGNRVTRQRGFRVLIRFQRA